MQMKKQLALLLAIALLVALLAGCGSKEETTDVQESAPVVEEVSSPEPEVAEPEEQTQGNLEDMYSMDSEEAIAAAQSGTLDFTAHKEMLASLTADLPLSDGSETLSIWLAFETAQLTYLDGGDLNNHVFFTTVQERTGVNLELIQVDSVTSQEKYNLMVASSEYPDLIPGSAYSTGLDAAIADEVILQLDDIIDQYCPNYKTILNSDSSIAKECQTPEGVYATFARIKDGVTTPNNEGAFLRMDWLEALGMDVPATYDELHEVLMAFKTEFGATEALMLKSSILPNSGLLTGGYGFTAAVSADGGPGGGGVTGFYQVDGQVKYGAATEEFKEFTLMLRDWYADGLLSEDCLTRETNPFGAAMTEPILSGKTGLFYNNQPFGDVYSAMSEDPDMNFFPVRDVVKEEGDINHFFEDVSMIAQGNVMGAFSISTCCENVELAARFCDALYIPEFYLLSNYGVEGEHWEYNDEGVPSYITEVLEGYPSTNIALATFCSSDLPGVFAESRLAFTFGEGAKAAFDVWKTDKDNAYALGSNTSLNTEENEQVSTISTDMLTYISEHYWKFVTGEEDIEAMWDEYLETLETMGLSEMTQVVQTAYDRAYGE